MTDCYRILGVPPTASHAAIRSAYLDLMKTLHPDAAPDLCVDGVAAEDVTRAYWQLRDPRRRAEHDARLGLQRPPAPARVPARPPRQIPASRARKPLPLRVQERRTARLRPMRTAAAALAFTMAVGGFVVAYTMLQPDNAGRARAATLVTAAPPVDATWEGERRKLDPAISRAAADEFAAVVRSSGLDRARAFGRQCLAELAARPSLSMLDFCIAYDDAGAAVEERLPQEEQGQLYFTKEQRLDRYRTLADSLRQKDIRTAMLDEVGYLGRREAY